MVGVIGFMLCDLDLSRKYPSRGGGYKFKEFAMFDLRLGRGHIQFFEFFFTILAYYFLGRKGDAFAIFLGIYLSGFKYFALRERSCVICLLLMWQIN